MFELRPVALASQESGEPCTPIPAAGMLELVREAHGPGIRVDSGVYTFTMGASGAVVKARYTFVYKWDGANWLIISHHSSAMPEG